MHTFHQLHINLSVCLYRLHSVCTSVNAYYTICIPQTSRNRSASFTLLSSIPLYPLPFFYFSLLRLQIHGMSDCARLGKMNNPRPAIFATAHSVCSPNDIRQGFSRTEVDIKGGLRV